MERNEQSLGYRIEEAIGVVANSVRSFVDTLRAYREDRVEVMRVNGDNPFRNDSYKKTIEEGFRRVRVGGPIGDLIDNLLLRGQILYGVQDIPDVIEDINSRKENK